MKRCYINVRERKHRQELRKLEIQKDTFFGVIKKNDLFITISALNCQKCFRCLSGFNWKEKAIKKKNEKKTSFITLTNLSPKHL